MKQMPGDPFDLLLGQAVAGQREGRLEAALAACDQALAQRPDSAQAHLRRGNVLRMLRRYDQAMAEYDRAIALAPDYGDPWFEKSTLLLLLGDFENGWRLYEWRWRTERNLKYERNIGRPLWLGEEPLAGKAILLHAEQGFGDVIQFARYAPMVAALGAKVILGVPDALAPLLRALPGVYAVVTKTDQVPSFDFHAPLMSLPLAFGTRMETIPAAMPYLSADPGKRRQWQARLGLRRRPRIGLAWSGRPTHHSDHHRSMPLRHLDPLLALDAEFHSLQKGARAADAAALASFSSIRRHEDLLQDFSDTAALIAELDLVITVDTAVAHLAGAMGRPVWILLSYFSDYRWRVDGADSPWYPSARLFRQRQAADWAGLIAEVCEALEVKEREKRKEKS